MNLVTIKCDGCGLTPDRWRGELAWLRLTNTPESHVRAPLVDFCPVCQEAIEKALPMFIGWKRLCAPLPADLIGKTVKP